MKKKHMVFLIAALAIQSPFAATGADGVEVRPDKDTFSLWNMPNEFAGSIPGIKEIDKAVDVMSKVAIKELGGKCSLSMANLIRMMTEIADEKIDENAIQIINLNWETAKVRFYKLP